ncbi:D-alanine--D-serine ligase VanG [Paenibacillus sp. R14(2021)]|uniref:D-alanine--D-serine ligase VanG n=1 Tax=Paenibacillus sp. R14(2021) TaxID=2859228 RepID=UPI001C615166|nr:D-alanine--D-serine ligase VanG [Paenibacillus sp. R14(2021)]
MAKLTLGVLFGGASTEYEVSLSSAAAVISQLDPMKYDIVLIGITQEGHWYRYGGGAAEIKDGRWSQHPSCVPAFLSSNRAMKGLFELAGTEYRFIPLDVVFPVLHGKNGEDGTLQGLLELAGFPFVGCDSLSSAICMDKVVAKTIIQAEGISVPPSITLRADVWEAERRIEPGKLSYPVYVKPARSGSSIGITKANNDFELTAGIEAALLHDDKIIIETHIEGVELGCAILGGAKPMTGELDEIELTGGFFDHAEKYSLLTSVIHLPARLSEAKATEARELALRIYRVLGCSGLARVDLFLQADGTLYFNEVNTIPGFTSTSRYPSMMREAGLDFPDLLDRLIADALRV